MGFSAERHHLHRTERGILQYLKLHEEGSFFGLTLESASTQPGNTTLKGMLPVGIAGCRKALLQVEQLCSHEHLLWARKNWKEQKR